MELVIQTPLDKTQHYEATLKLPILMLERLECAELKRASCRIKFTFDALDHFFLPKAAETF